MSMERHRCKLCSRIFSNGRALGGHMRSHLATLPLPPKKNNKTEQSQPQPQLGDRTESDSSSTRSDPNASVYLLRENPKKSAKASDPDSLFDAASTVIVQDRESETESTQNPTRRRSKRRRHPQSEAEQPKTVAKSESATESNPVSSVSDVASHQDEEVALCLMMLSRDVWVEDTNESTRLSLKKKFTCLRCKKMFRTNRALAGHKASSKECQEESYGGGDEDRKKIYECPFCYKVFGSGQALGGHKRSHLLGFGGSSSTTTTTANTTNIVAAATNHNHVLNDVNNGGGDKVGDFSTTSLGLDLNLPAPLEDDDDYHSQQLQFL